MKRPNTRVLLKTLTLSKVINELELFINSNPKNEYYLANLDLLRLYGKSLQGEKFYKLALYLTSQIRNPAIYREVARFAYFVEKDAKRARVYAEKAIAENENEALWVHYIARKDKTYFEKLFENLYLTSIPKNASTSLKTMVLESLHNKKGVNPHSVFGNPFFSTNTLGNNLTANDLKLISIREPISRFLSYYNKNIIEEGSLQEELSFTKKNEEFNLPLKPDIDFFIENLNLYCYTFNDVLHHILPQTAYFQSLSVYDCIADIKDSYKLGEAVSNKLGLKNKISPPKKMVSSKKVNSIVLSNKSQERLTKLFKDDLLVYRNNKTEKKYSFCFN